MPINAHPEYLEAEKKYLQATTLEEKIEKLRKMISLAPSHKGAENLRAQLTTRLKKFQEQLKKQKSSGKSSKIGIKKHDMQTTIVGKTNSGKSSLLSILTNQKPKIANYKFTTKHPKVGILNYQGTNIQTIENPAIDSEFYDKSITHTTDSVLILINKLEEIKEIEKQLNALGKIIVVFNKIEEMTSKEKRKINATLKSKHKKHEFVLISCKTGEGIEDLKEKIFQSFDKIRIYTKQPGEKKSKKPMILEKNSNVKDVAEKILKGFSDQIKETRITGPSSKFPNQKVGLKHKLKDLDVVEFKTK